MSADAPTKLLSWAASVRPMASRARCASSRSPRIRWRSSDYGPLATNRPGLTIEIVSARTTTNVLVARLKGVNDRNAAEKLNGVELFVDRDRLPPTDDDDDFYHADLIGLDARLADGTVLGKVSAVPNFGAGDLIEVSDAQTGDTYLYPFTRAVVPEIHVEGGLSRHRDPARRRTRRGGARLSFAADIVTLFPELFPGPLGASVIGRGAAQGLWSLHLTQLRDFADRQASHRRRHAGRRRRRHGAEA